MFKTTKSSNLYKRTATIALVSILAAWLIQALFINILKIELENPVQVKSVSCLFYGTQHKKNEYILIPPTSPSVKMKVLKFVAPNLNIKSIMLRVKPEIKTLKIRSISMQKVIRHFHYPIEIYHIQPSLINFYHNTPKRNTSEITIYHPGNPIAVRYQPHISVLEFTVTVLFIFVVISGIIFLPLRIFQLTRETSNIMIKRTIKLGKKVLYSCFLYADKLLNCKYLAAIAKFPPEQLFPYVFFLGGLACTIINPPFMSPDEPAHFYRAVQLSEKMTPIVKYSEKGIPITCEQLANSFKFLKDWHTNSKTSVDFIHKKLSAFKTDSHTPTIEVSTYSRTIPYIFQIVAITAAKFFSPYPLVWFFSARITNMLCCGIIFWMTLKITKSFRYVILFSIMMPMTLFIASSLSQDGLTNALALMLTALILKARFEHKKFPGHLYILLVVITFLLGLCKPPYFLLCILWIIIPLREKSETQAFPVKHIIFIFILLLAGITACNLSFLLSLITPSYSDHNVINDSSIINVTNQYNKYQLDFIIHNPLSFISILSSTTLGYIVGWVKSCIGILGWLNLRFPTWFYLVYILILFTALHSHKRKITISDKVVCTAVSGIIFLVIMTGLYVFWTSKNGVIGGQIVKGVQGRYFIPFLPAFLLIFYRKNSFLRKCLFKFSSVRNIILQAGIVLPAVMMIYIIIKNYYV